LHEVRALKDLPHPEVLHRYRRREQSREVNHDGHDDKERAERYGRDVEAPPERDERAPGAEPHTAYDRHETRIGHPRGHELLNQRVRKDVLASQADDYQAEQQSED